MAWLSLRMRYGPFLGARYICGASIDQGEAIAAEQAVSVLTPSPISTNGAEPSPTLAGALAAGGESRPYQLDPQQEQFCRDVMQRAHFPFAHLDLHIMADGQYCLSEIALNGGIRAARIDRAALEDKKDAVIDRLIEALRS